MSWRDEKAWIMYRPSLFVWNVMPSGPGGNDTERDMVRKGDGLLSMKGRHGALLGGRGSDEERRNGEEGTEED